MPRQIIDTGGAKATASYALKLTLIIVVALAVLGLVVFFALHAYRSGLHADAAVLAFAVHAVARTA